MKKTVLQSTLGALIAVSFSVSAYQDISQEDAFYTVMDYENAFIIDVRTDAEWEWVGHPGENRSGFGAFLEGKVINESWKVYHNKNFVDNPQFISDINFLFKHNKDAILITMCRSGVRSIAAAEALDAAGYTNVYNMINGFEGDRDADGYRTVNGWKVEGFPYTTGRGDKYDVDRND
ncbi:MAG: rhodanese-like domain-containing protein [Candidatus Thiodiazotropha sp.]